LEKLGLPETPESIEQVIPDLRKEILREIHSELEKFGPGLKDFRPDPDAIGFSAMASVIGPKSVVLTRPVVMKDPSYQHKWPMAINAVIAKLEKHCIHVDAW